MLFLLLIGFVNGAFVNVQPLSLARSDLTAVSLEKQKIVFFAGGYDLTNKPLNNIDIYNFASNSWSTAVLQLARGDMTSASLDNYGLVFFAGGYISTMTVTNFVDIFNINTNIWTSALLSQARGNLAGTSLPEQGLVFFAGGDCCSTNNLNVYSNIDVFSIVKNEWSQLYLSINRSQLAATSLPNKGIVFFAGGWDGNNNPYNVIDVFDFVKNKNYQLYLSQYRYALCATSIPSGLVFFAGGTGYNNYPINTIDIYDANTGKMSIKLLQYPREYMVSLSINNYIFFAGGDINNLPFSTIEIYDASSDKFYTSNMSSPATMFAGASLSNEGLVFFGGGQTNNAINNVNVFGNCTPGTNKIIQPYDCISCPAGYFCSFTVLPIICPLGAYCPANSSNAIKCPAGTYGNSMGLKNISDCISCPAGTYNSIVGQTMLLNCLPCNNGFYCPVGSPIPEPCPTNYYCPSFSEKIACPAGTYSDNSYAISINTCVSCLKGHYCPGNGLFPSACLPGSYSNKFGNIVCNICPEGYSCAYGSENPIICPLNTAAPKGSPACTPCSPGQFTKNEGGIICESCPGGQFSIDGWWCMTQYERLVFCFLWIGSIFSGIVTIWKLNSFVKERIMKLRDNQFGVNWNNFIFLEQLLKKRKRDISLITYNNDINKLYQQLDERISILESNNS